MSFDVNIGRPQPVIKAAAGTNNDGGSGGNTGYMMRGRKKKDEKNYKNPFDSNHDIDSFEMASKLPKNESESLGMKPTWFENMIDKLIK